MRRHAFLLALLLASAPGAALAQAKAADPKPQTEPAKPRKPATLDELFTRLAGAKDEGEANGVANLIERRWARSGSDTADLLMSRAEEALKAKEFPLAVELLDRVLTLRPEWAEAWHRRATAFFLLDDPVSAIADIQRVLTREPRHFGAWAGLGAILEATGDKKNAYAAYQKAIGINPHMPAIQKELDDMKLEVEGQDI